MIMAGVAANLMARAQTYNRWIEHTYAVESQVAQLEAEVERAETARRGYLLSPDAVYRRTFESAEAEVAAQLDRLAVQVFDNPRQAARVAALRRLTGEREARIARMMAFAAKGEVEASVESFRRDRDQPLLGEVRAITAQMLGCARSSPMLKPSSPWW
jgi:CHASE3 domain sensor protein